MSVSRALLGTGDLGMEFSYGVANFLEHWPRRHHSLPQFRMAQAGPIWATDDSDHDSNFGRVGFSSPSWPWWETCERSCGPCQVDSLVVGGNCPGEEKHSYSLRLSSAYPASKGPERNPRTWDLCPIVTYTSEDWRDGTGPGKQSPGQTWQPPSKLCLLTRSQAQAGLVQWLPGSPVQLGP